MPVSIALIETTPESSLTAMTNRTERQWQIVNSLLLATIIRSGFAVITYGCKVPGGIFIPSMAVGATFGRMLGIMVKAMYTCVTSPELLENPFMVPYRAYPTSGIFKVCAPDRPCITPGTYAFLGAAAALSGVMRITVTVVVVMFELTGALTYILPTMVRSTHRRDPAPTSQFPRFHRSYCS